MRKFIGFFRLLAGVAFGAFAFYPESLDRETKLAEITEILAAPAGGTSRRVPDVETTRSFAPSHEIIIRKPEAAPASPSNAPQVAAAPAPARSSAQPTQILPPPSNGWQAVVTQDGVTSSKPGDGHSRYELVLNIQRELKRAGCYGGTLSGSWSANTKRAMSSFMERVNATLPIDEPDYILLTLIKGQAAASCVTCPLGQTLADGRCMPNAVIAQKKQPQPKAPETGFTTTTAIAEADTTLAAAPPSVTPLPGRMAVGAPKVETPTAPPVAQGTWKPKVVTAPKPAAAPAPVAEAASPAMPAAAPAAAPAQVRIAPPAPAPAMPVKTKTAALLEEEAVAPVVPDQEPAAQPPAPAPAVTAPLVPATPQLPQTGMPGSKSGAAAVPGTTAGQTVYAPVPRPQYTIPVRPRASAPRPRPVARPSKAQRYYARRAPDTRSVQSLFMHPLGRM